MKVLQIGKTEMVDIRIFLLEGTLVVLCQSDDDESKVKGFRSQLAELADGLPENKVCAQLLAEAKKVCEAADRAQAAAGPRPKLFLGRPCALCACALWRQLERRFPQLSLY